VISASERRTVRFMLLLLIPALVYRLGVVPYRAALSSAREQLAAAQDALTRERSAVQTARRNPALRDLTDTLMRAAAPRLFAGDDDVIASAQLASYVGDLAQQLHVWVQDAATRPTLASTGVRTLHVEVRAESDLQGILAWLQGLERGDKLVSIERLDISRALSSPENEHAETLTLSATVAGYALVAAPVPARSSP
jgi:hypothetical protein